MIEPSFKIKAEKKKKDYGKFTITPLAQGYGHTLGNALRRVLLTSIEGAAVTKVKIEGVKHQFSTIAGVSEDVVKITLNIKKIRLKIKGEGPVKLTLSATGPGEVKAGDIKAPAKVEIVNKDLVLATLNDKKTKLEMEMTADKGYGYVPFEERKTEEMGVIPLDSTFSPILRVNYKVEETRVGRMTNLDKLVLEVWTDGTREPLEAIKQAAKKLVAYFRQIYEPKEPEKEEEERSLLSERMLKASVEELELPTRMTNALLRAKIKKLSQLLPMTRMELLKIRNLGTKSVSLIEKKLKEKGLELGS